MAIIKVLKTKIYSDGVWGRETRQSSTHVYMEMIRINFARLVIVCQAVQNVIFHTQISLVNALRQRRDTFIYGCEVYENYSDAVTCKRCFEETIYRIKIQCKKDTYKVMHVKRQ